MLKDDAAAGLGIADLNHAISKLHDRVDMLGEPPVAMPEVVNSTNALRANAYLEEKNALLLQLVSYYATYAERLASLADSVIDVQSGLVEVLRMQSAMIEDADVPSAKPPARRSSKNTGAKKTVAKKAPKLRPKKATKMPSRQSG